MRHVIIPHLLSFTHQEEVKKMYHSKVANLYKDEWVISNGADIHTHTIKLYCISQTVETEWYWEMCATRCSGSHLPLIPAFQMLRQEDHCKFKNILAYIAGSRRDLENRKHYIKVKWHRIHCAMHGHSLRNLLGCQLE